MPLSKGLNLIYIMSEEGQGLRVKLGSDGRRQVTVISKTANKSASKPPRRAKSRQQPKEDVSREHTDVQEVPWWEDPKNLSNQRLVKASTEPLRQDDGKLSEWAQEHDASHKKKFELFEKRKESRPKRQEKSKARIPNSLREAEITKESVPVRVIDIAKPIDWTLDDDEVEDLAVPIFADEL